MRAALLLLSGVIPSHAAILELRENNSSESVVRWVRSDGSVKAELTGDLLLNILDRLQLIEQQFYPSSSPPPPLVPPPTPPAPLAPHVLARAVGNHGTGGGEWAATWAEVMAGKSQSGSWASDQTQWGWVGLAQWPASGTIEMRCLNLNGATGLDTFSQTFTLDKGACETNNYAIGCATFDFQWDMGCYSHNGRGNSLSTTDLDRDNWATSNCAAASGSGAAEPTSASMAPKARRRRSAVTWSAMASATTDETERSVSAASWLAWSATSSGTVTVRRMGSGAGESVTQRTHWRASCYKMRDRAY